MASADSAAVAQSACSYVRLARVASCRVPLMAHVDAAVSAMTRHGDVATVVENGLAFLANEVNGPVRKAVLMVHVGAVVSAMTRHGGGVVAVVENGLWFLANEADESESKAAMMTHVDAVVSAMTPCCNVPDVAVCSSTVLLSHPPIVCR